MRSAEGCMEANTNILRTGLTTVNSRVHTAVQFLSCTLLDGGEALSSLGAIRLGQMEAARLIRQSEYTHSTGLFISLITPLP